MRYQQHIFIASLVASQALHRSVLFASSVSKLKMLIIKGDNDGVELEHVAEMYKAFCGGISGDMGGIPKSQLSVIPGTSHVSLIMATRALVNVINPFWDKAN